MRLKRRLDPESETAADCRFAPSLYFSASALARATEKLAIECFRPTGLNPSLAYIVLLLLDSNISSVSNAYLARTLLLSQSTMVRHVDQLVKKGFMERFEYDDIPMICLTEEALDQYDLFIRCSNDFAGKCDELLGAENRWKLAREMNEATDKLRLGVSAAAGALPDIAAGECPTADEKSGRESRSLPRKLIVMSTPEQGRTVETAYLQKSISYEAYTRLIDELVTNGQTTGPDQSEAFIHYTALNQQRMHRWEKTIQLLPSAETALKSVTVPQTWLVLTEAWCGDAAHSIPVLHALAALNPLITLRFVFRDENPELMDRYLTNGVSRSIPKLIALDTATREELFTWGPRPTPLQATFLKMREEGIAYAAIKEELQRWYNKDRSVTIQQEMAALATATNTGMGMTA